MVKKWELEIRVKKNQPCFKIYHKSAHCSRFHPDAHDRLDNMSTYHKPHFPQITSVFKPSHDMVRSTEERFATVRIATRGFGSKKIATTLGLPQSTTMRRLLGLRSDGDMVSRNIGRPRGAEAGWCVMSSEPKISGTLNLKMGQEVPKTLENGFLG